MPEWIKVTDHLPEFSRSIVWYNIKYKSGIVTKAAWWYSNWYGCIDSWNIEYWAKETI